MAENDIYDNQKRYLQFKKNLHKFANKPKAISKRKYYCKNKQNLQYFDRLFSTFEARDISFVRRMRLIQSFRLICFSTNKNLKDCERKDIDEIVTQMHSVYKSAKSKSDFLRDIKLMWKIIFPEKDERGNEDETLVPYVVRHLRGKIDKSKDKLRNDRLSFDEFEKIVSYFSRDPRMQSYITLAQESLGRPQEILYTRIRDVRLYDNYAKIYISEHGKEGCGFLQCIDSFPYLVKWLEVHPFRKNPDSYLFIDLKKLDSERQLKPTCINAKLKNCCKHLKIEKPITCYSLKRNGVTMRRLRGESDVEIQHVARWTSTRQLKTYDFSNQEDALKRQLIRKGLIDPDKENEHLVPKLKTCQFCGKTSGFCDDICQNCKRPLNREQIVKQQMKENADMETLRREMAEMKAQLTIRKDYDDDLRLLLEHPEVQKLYRNICRGNKLMDEMEA